MTAAGVGSLLICQRQMDRFRSGQGRRGTSSLLTKPALDRGKPARLSSVDPVGPDQPCVSERAGVDLVEFRTGKPHVSPANRRTYMLYGLERIGALADRQTIGRLDWFEKGRTYLRSSQQR